MDSRRHLSREADLLARAFGDDDEAIRMFWEQGPDQHLKDLIRGDVSGNPDGRWTSVVVGDGMRPSSPRLDSTSWRWTASWSGPH